MKDKSDQLNLILQGLGSYAVAFSGGVDSSFLLHRAGLLNKPDIIALTIRTPYIPVAEIEEATYFAKKNGVRHQILDVGFPTIIKNNPIDRCYLCKTTLFRKMIDFARENNFSHIIDGSNADDAGEFRPGMRALKEMGIRSPLLEAGLTKKEIRSLCKTEGLTVWDKPAQACLLTRIPYDTEVKEGTLRMIEASENLLFEKGFPGTRVRVHGEVARIECMPGFIEKILHAPDRHIIVSSLKELGFKYVSVDLEGYKSGSLNPEIKNNEH